jgi:hypothetical protein
VVGAINKSMALSPDERFSTAAELGNALYHEFKTMVERSPADVLYHFIKNPGAPIEFDATAGSGGAGLKSKKTIVIAAAAAAAVLMLVVLFAVGKLTGIL